MDITTQVIGVEGKNRQTSRGPGTIYTISFADGTQAQTWEAPLASKAQGLVGQTVTAQVTTKQNGQYTNTYLDGIDLASGTPAPQNGVANAQATLNNAPPFVGGVPPIPVTQDDGFQRRRHPEDEARIVKQSLLSTSLGFVGQLYSGAGPEAQAEALEAGLTIAKALYAEVMGGQAPAPAPTPQAVAAAVPGVQVGSEDLKTW